MTITVDKIGTTYNTNILGPQNWTAGSGGVAAAGGYVAFNQNGATAEQNRYIGTDPWGNSALVWQTVPTSTNDADGGWDTGAFSIDASKLYRFSVWVRRTSSTSSGTFYFGSQSSTGGVMDLATRTNTTNPYWDYRGTSSLTQNVWYLFVGHIFPVGFPSVRGHAESGVYTVAGNKVGELLGNTPKDQAWQSGTTTGTHRTYHYYCTDSTTRLEFYDPRVEICNGKEPSVQALLSGPINTNTQAIIYSDGSAQVSGNFGSDGQLIDITTFTSSGTWYKPNGAKYVHVKLIGGGGGSAGYNEAGGAGGYAEGMYDVTGVSSVTVTIGGGGPAVVYYAAAGQGGTTSFGSYISATGGYGANQNYSHSGGAGGSGSGGSINLQGGGGNGHVNSVGTWPGGRGGQGYFGGSASFIRNHGNISSGWLGKVNNGSPGAGGPGALTDGSTTGGNYGGAGENGIVVIYSYK